MGNLFGHSGFPANFPTVGAIVVAHEQPRRTGQRQHATYRPKQCPRIAAGKIGPGRPAIGHEQRVADKGRIAHHMRCTGGCMARRMDDKGGHSADLIGIAIFEQPVKLTAIPLKIGPFVEHLSKRVLNDGYVFADANLAAQFALNIGRA